MDELAPSERLLLSGLSCSVLVLAAGLIATLHRPGIAIASGLLTLAAIVAVAGFSNAKQRRWSVGHWVLLAAALPLFFALYGVGLSILRFLGQAVAGGLLIGIAALLATATGIVTLQWRKGELREHHR